MAGMLPGVECARRRRFPQGGSAAEPQLGSRRSSFCLYASNQESHLASKYMVLDEQKRSTAVHGTGGCSTVLERTAREAKERLDGKLFRNQRKDHNMGSTGGGHGVEMTERLQREVFCWKRRRWRSAMAITGGMHMMGWNMKARVEDEEECVVCLEEFRTGDAVVKLPCTHRFHWSCVVPWLKGSSSCPCCRTQIKTS